MKQQNVSSWVLGIRCGVTVPVIGHLSLNWNVRPTGMGPAEGHRGNWGWYSWVWGSTGFVLSSEEKTEGRYYCCLQLPRGGCRWDEAKHFSEMHTERMRSSRPKLKLRKFWSETRKKKKIEHEIFTGTGAQRGDGISNLGDIWTSSGWISEQPHLTSKLACITVVIGSAVNT